jgi:ketosteroid isomerase-like protein
MVKTTSLLMLAPVGAAAAALLLGSVGVASGDGAQGSERADDARASLLEADRAMSRIYRDRDAFSEFIAPDVWFLPPDAPRAQGRDTFLDACESFVEMDLAFSPDVAEVSDAGDFGVTIGTFHLTVEGPDGGPLQRTGKYQTTWRRQDDGRWMVVADMFNFDSPMAAAES